MEQKNYFDFTGKTALITGASRGLGKNFAEAAALAGANIVVVNTKKETGQIVADELAEKYHVKTMAIAADISDYDSCNQMAEEAASAFGSIDICVANAGIARRDLAEDFKPEDWKKVIDVNLNGVFFTDQAVGRIMIKQNHGSIINITSIRAHTACHPHTGVAYPAAKAGVLMLTKALAKEWAKYNVRVNALCPGYIRTEIFDGVSEYVKAWEDLTAMERIGKPEELRSALLYLASDASSFTTGTEVVVDGGYMTF